MPNTGPSDPFEGALRINRIIDAAIAAGPLVFLGVAAALRAGRPASSAPSRSP